MEITIHIDEEGQKLCRDCIFNKRAEWTPALACSLDDTCYFGRIHCDKRVSKEDIKDAADTIRVMVKMLPDEELVKMFN